MHNQGMKTEAKDSLQGREKPEHFFFFFEERINMLGGSRVPKRNLCCGLGKMYKEA